MATRFLDTNGLHTLWEQIKSLFLSKDDAQALANSLNSIRENVGLESDLSLPNDFGYTTIVDGVKAKQNALVAGENITISGNTISAANTMYDDTEVKNDIEALNTNKQDKLTAGSNISINGNTISSTYTYNDTAVKNDIANLKTNKQDKLQAGSNITISGNTINVDDVFLTKEDANSIANSIEKIKQSTGLDKNLNLPENFNYSSIIEGIESKQEKLTSGNNIIISNDNIISTDNNLFKSISSNGVGNVITSLETDNNGTLITNKSYVS